MKKHRPVKHAHRRAMIAEKKSKGKYSRCHLPNSWTCHYGFCSNCWASTPSCGYPNLRLFR